MNESYFFHQNTHTLPCIILLSLIVSSRKFTLVCKSAISLSFSFNWLFKSSTCLHNIYKHHFQGLKFYFILLSLYFSRAAVHFNTFLHSVNFLTLQFNLVWTTVFSHSNLQTSSFKISLSSWSSWDFLLTHSTAESKSIDYVAVTYGTHLLEFYIGNKNIDFLLNYVIYIFASTFNFSIYYLYALVVGLFSQSLLSIKYSTHYCLPFSL